MLEVVVHMLHLVAYMLHVRDLAGYVLGAGSLPILSLPSHPSKLLSSTS